MSDRRDFLPGASLLAAAVAAALGLAAEAAAANERGRYLYVANRGSADVAVIDTVTDRVVQRVKVGNAPHQVVVADALGKLIASNTQDNTISIVDLETLETEATLALDAGPEHMELAAGGALLAVGNLGAGTVSLVSLAEKREVARIGGLIEPHNLTFGPDGALLYVANLGADHVSVIDVALARIVDEIVVAGPTALGAKGGGDDAEYQGIINVTRTPDGSLGFAAHGEGDSLSVIDLRTRSTLKRLQLGDLPWRAYATADGRYMLVPNNGARTVSVISTATLDVVATLPGAEDMTGVNTGWFETTAFVLSRGEDKAVVLDLVGMSPAGEIALPGTPETGVTSPDGRRLYVALSGAGKVAVIDTRARQVVKMIDDVGAAPWGATMVGSVPYCH